LLALTFAGSAIQLVPDGTLLLHLAIIVLMVALLNVTLLRPINRILEERDERTKGRLTEAQSILANIRTKMSEYERRVRDARAQGYKVLENERTALAREREQEMGQVKLEVTRWSDEEKRQLMIDAERVKASLERDALRTAQEIGRRILRREIAVEDLANTELE
jgi:F-type H+-transporting ATPase subunit b